MCSLFGNHTSTLKKKDSADFLYKYHLGGIFCFLFVHLGNKYKWSS